MAIQGTDQIKDLYICIVCNALFKEWTREIECADCDEGTAEIPQDFGDSFTWEDCKTCNAKGVTEWQEKAFCSEDCGEEWMEKQHEY